jgi:hypothetical protein
MVHGLIKDEHIEEVLEESDDLYESEDGCFWDVTPCSLLEID